MSFIDKYYTIFNNSVGQHSVTINRAEFANLLGVFSKQEQQLDQLKVENEILEKVNKNNQEKIKKLNETLEEEFIAKQYGDEALFFTLMDIKEIAKKSMKEGQMISGGWLYQKISEVIKDEQ